VSHLDASRHEAECPGGRDESGGAAGGAARESGRGHEHEDGGKNQESLRGFLMTVQRAARHHALDAVLLRFASLRGDPGAQSKRCSQCHRYGPYPTRRSAFPDNPEGDRDRDWKQCHEHDWEVDDERVQWYA